LEKKKMKKAKFWLSQIILVAIVSLVLSSPVLADKPAEKQNKGKGKGSDSTTTETSTTGGGSTSDGTYPCPEGYVWLDFYSMCIPR
jgi:hypothetical protein